MRRFYQWGVGVVLLFMLISCGLKGHFYFRSYYASEVSLRSDASIGVITYGLPILGNLLMGEMLKNGIKVKPIYFFENLVAPTQRNVLPNTGIKIKVDTKLENFEEFLRSKIFSAGELSYEYEKEVKKVFDNLKDNYQIKYILFVWEKKKSSFLKSELYAERIEAYLINLSDFSLASYQLIKVKSPSPLKFDYYRKIVKYVIIPVLMGQKPLKLLLKFKNGLSLELKYLK